MTVDIPELRSFRALTVDLERAHIFARVAGTGPPLLLLHGFPQTHACWARIAPQLAQHFTLVLADLTGYGDSRGPPVEKDGANYSKRAIANHMVELMQALGHERFCLAGHDRGARVAYRLALDHPQRAERLAALSILPTFAMWRRLGDVSKAIHTYHWFLLAQEPPIPHDLLAGAPGKQVRNTLASWTKARSLDPFTPLEIAAYEEAFSRAEVIAAVCGEYRANWTVDRELDEADVARQHRIVCPMLALWGTHEYTESEMISSWRQIADDVTARPLDCGHFVTEELPEATTAALVEFFGSARPGE
jgi:haloacetate dehalogenase